MRLIHIIPKIYLNQLSVRLTQIIHSPLELWILFKMRVQIIDMENSNLVFHDFYFSTFTTKKLDIHSAKFLYVRRCSLLSNFLITERLMSNDVF